MSSNFDASAASKHFDVHSGAVYLGVSEITLRRMIAANQIEHLRVAPSRKRILFTQEMLDGYLSRCAQPVAA
jgi:excisionase family DNA binding protein